jgi:hypothetical protein
MMVQLYFATPSTSELVFPAPPMWSVTTLHFKGTICNKLVLDCIQRGRGISNGKSYHWRKLSEPYSFKPAQAQHRTHGGFA